MSVDFEQTMTDINQKDGESGSVSLKKIPLTELPGDGFTSPFALERAQSQQGPGCGVKFESGVKRDIVRETVDGVGVYDHSNRQDNVPLCHRMSDDGVRSDIMNDAQMTALKRYIELDPDTHP